MNSFRKYNRSFFVLILLLAIFIIFSYFYTIDEPGNSITKIILQIGIFSSFVRIANIHIISTDDEPTLKLAIQVIVYVLVIVYISPQIVYLILLYIRYNPDYILNIGNQSDWIGFSGSIIGGSLTLFAVFFAFVLEKKQRESDIDLRSVPKLIVDWYFSKNIEKGYYVKKDIIRVAKNTENLKHDVRLHLINDSVNVATDMKLIESKLVFYKDIDKALNDDSLPIKVIDFTDLHSIESNLTNFLFNNAEHIFVLPVSFPVEFTYLDRSNSESILVRLKIKLKYRSIIKLRDYYGLYEINYHIQKLPNNHPEIIDYDRYNIIIENIRSDYDFKMKK